MFLSADPFNQKFEEVRFLKKDMENIFNSISFSFNMYLESSRSQQFLSAVWYILLDGINTKLLHLLILSNMLLVVFSTFLEYF